MVALLSLVVLAMAGCGAGGGAADPQSIADAAVKKILAKDFDSVFDLTDTSGQDTAGLGEIREWRITEKYDLWKDYKKRLEGDDGMDPKSKSGIDGEEAWKNMSQGKGWALRQGYYRLYANDDLDKRLEMRWAMANREMELKEEGHGGAEFRYMNGYGDSIKVECYRLNGLWYLASAKVSMEKELPKKPKDE
ncbi:MAG: hypothetical protein IPK87_04560 [Planctomycetes bacterium]|nr:hypothetical protein [Planctomycetota bacterium]